MPESAQLFEEVIGATGELCEAETFGGGARVGRQVTCAVGFGDGQQIGVSEFGAGNVERRGEVPVDGERNVESCCGLVTAAECGEREPEPGGNRPSVVAPVLAT